MTLADHTAEDIPKAPIAKLKHSSFFITVNSNGRSYNDEKTTRFKKAMSVLFEESGKGIFDYIEEGRTKDPNFKDKIEKIFIEGAFENLSDKGTGETHFVSLHLHVYVDIAHRTNVSINYNQLRSDIQKYLPGAYINTKTIERHVKSIEEYINKFENGTAGRETVELSIDHNAPTFREWLGEQGVTEFDTVKSNFHSKMEKEDRTGGKSILGQIMTKDKSEHLNILLKVGAKRGISGKDNIIDDLIVHDANVTAEEIKYFDSL